MKNRTSWVKETLRKWGEPQLFHRFAAGIVMLALVARLVVFVCFWPRWIWHTGHVHDSWDELAINWVSYGTFGYQPNEPTIQRGPIFPLLEVPLYLLFGRNYTAWSIALLLFDTGTCLLVVLLARRLWGNRAALLAGLFYAVHIPIIYYGANIEQVTSALPLVMLWFYLWSKWSLESARNWVPWVIGLTSGVLILNKTVYLPVVLASTLWIVWRKRRDPQLRTVLRQASIVLLTASLVVVPWTLRNYVVTGGAFVPVQGLFWQNAWETDVHADLDAIEGADRPEGRTLQYVRSRKLELLDRAEGRSGVKLTGPKREMYNERVFKGQVLEWFRSKPTRLLKHIIRNFWGFWVLGENLRKTLLMLGMQVVFMGAALLGLGLIIRFGQLQKVEFGLLLVLTLWAEHSLVHGRGRYSLDIVPVLAIVFGTGIDHWMKQQIGSNPPT